VYHHDPAVANPREAHLALDGRAFRYDDPIWDEITSPNGWGCRCYTTTESEHGAEKAGIDVLHSGADGAKPDIPGVNWDKFDETWRYNPGRESLAPNFTKYKNLSESDIRQIQARYHQDMNNTRLTEGEFKTLLRRANETE
jgi:hypothetical protein